MIPIARRRTYQTPHVDEELTIEDLDVNSGLWNVTSIVPVESRLQDHRESAMVDVECHGKFVYHDCDHQKFISDIGVVDTSTQHRVPLLRTEGSNLAFPQRYHIPCGKIMNDLYKTYGPGFSARYPVKRILNWMYDVQLPTRIIVDRDPFESDFSIWFLVDDIVRLPSLVGTMFSRPIIRRPEAFGTRSIKQLADDDLMVKFGVLAFWVDLVDFVGVCKRFLRGYEEYVKADKFYRWHDASGLIDLAHAVPPTPVLHLPWQGTLGSRRFTVETVTTVESCRFTRTMAYRLACPELKGWISRFKQFIDAFGILDPAILWDRVPFSFVVDWFLPFGQWFRKNKPRLFTGAILCKDYCESVKVKYSVDYVVRPPDGEAQSWSANICQEDHSSYVRRRFQPDIGEFELGRQHPLLSVRQGIIASSLVAQRLPRPGSIGDLFEGVDFGQDPFPVNGTDADMDHAVNKAWADQQRQRKSALAGGTYPMLRRFEMSKSDIRKANEEDLKRLNMLPRRTKRGQIEFVQMRKRTWEDLRNAIRTGAGH